jgi:hypothetical protein
MVLRALEHEQAGPMEVRISMSLAVRRSCGCTPNDAADRGRAPEPVTTNGGADAA